jgi:hypothetical protein
MLRHKESQEESMRDNGHITEYAIQVVHSGLPGGLLRDGSTFGHTVSAEDLPVRTFSNLEEATLVMDDLVAQYHQLSVHTAMAIIVERTVTTTRSEWRSVSMRNIGCST